MVGYLYFYYNTETKETDYVGITKGLCRRIKEHKKDHWLTDKHIIAYVRMDEKYLQDSEYILISELKPKYNIVKRNIPQKLEGYSTNWDYLKEQFRIFDSNLRIADYFR